MLNPGDSVGPVVVFLRDGCYARRCETGAAAVLSKSAPKFRRYWDTSKHVSSVTDSNRFTLRSTHRSGPARRCEMYILRLPLLEMPQSMRWLNTEPGKMKISPRYPASAAST